MKLKKILDSITVKKYGCCESCHKMTDLRRVKVSSYAGFPSYKFLCKTCELLERLKKYWRSFLIRRGLFSIDFSGDGYEIFSCLPPRHYKVYLDYLLLYINFDKATRMPVFIGVMQELNNSNFIIWC